MRCPFSFWSRALDNNEIEIAAHESVLGCVLIFRALIPGLRFFHGWEFKYRDTLHVRPLLHVARSGEARQPSELRFGWDTAVQLAVKLKLCGIARAQARHNYISNHLH